MVGRGRGPWYRFHRARSSSVSLPARLGIGSDRRLPPAPEHDGSFGPSHGMHEYRDACENYQRGADRLRDRYSGPAGSLMILAALSPFVESEPLHRAESTYLSVFLNALAVTGRRRIGAVASASAGGIESQLAGDAPQFLCTRSKSCFIARFREGARLTLPGTDSLRCQTSHAPRWASLVPTPQPAWGSAGAAADEAQAGLKTPTGGRPLFHDFCLRVCLI